MRKWIIIGIGAAALAVVVILGLMRAAQKREQAEKFAARREISVAVEVTAPEIATIEETKTFLGTVVSTDQATVFSKIPGKVVALPAAVGKRVARGATVAVIDYDQPGMKFRYYNAYAPISGEVAAVMVNVGDTVSPSTPLAAVVKPESVKLETAVPAEALAVMYKGQTVKIRARGREGDFLAGEVINLPRSLSPESHLAKVEIKPKAEASGLRAGMFAQVEVPVARRENALLVPPQALRREAEGMAVYVAEGNVIRRRAVAVGLSREDAVQITSGLDADDDVVVYANGDLDDGIKIIKKVPYRPHE
jgi:multidrug efflux pump subunit AcrA (membrane-fusion protein)